MTLTSCNPVPIPVSDCALLVGTNRRLLLLNPAARRDAERGLFQPPAGFFDFDHIKAAAPIHPARPQAPPRRRVVTLLDRQVTIQSPAAADVEGALLPWSFCSRRIDDAVVDCDLTVEVVGNRYRGQVAGRKAEDLPDWTALSAWLSREITSLVHSHHDWFATLHAGGIVYDGKLIAFPGSSHSGKSTLMASLCMEGLPYFSEDCLPILDSSLRAAAVPLAIKLRHPSWRLFRDRLPDFDILPQSVEAGVPVKFWQPPAHNLRSAPIEALVFPHFEPNAPAEWRRLPLLDTVLEILASESGPVQWTAQSWRELLNSLAKIPAFEICYGSVEESHRLLRIVANESA